MFAEFRKTPSNFEGQRDQFEQNGFLKISKFEAFKLEHPNGKLPILNLQPTQVTRQRIHN